MTWYDPRTWFGSTDQSSRPPKPESEERTQTKERDVYKYIVEYRNGDTETFEAYGRTTGGEQITFPTAVGWDVSRLTGGNSIHESYPRKRHEHYETLNREPISEHLRTETYELEYTVDYEYTDHGWFHKEKKWREEIVPESLEVTKVD